MSSPTPIRFGTTAGRTDDAETLRALARRAEDLGYSTIYVPDHFVDHPLAPIPTMAAVAASTTTLRVGSLVLGNDYKHPVVVAKEAATIDVLSNGRLELGIGAGWMTVDYEQAGIPLDPPGVRIARLAESVAILKGLWADEPFSFAGDHYTVTALDGDPKPVQRPRPPPITSGGGPKVLAFAAREADIVGINANLHGGKPDDPSTAPSMSPSATDEKVQWVRDAAGARFADLEIQTLSGFVHFTDDASQMRQMMAGPFQASPDDVLDSPAILVGTVDEMIESLERRRARWDMSYHVVPIEQMDAFAPVVAKLAGT